MFPAVVTVTKPAIALRLRARRRATTGGSGRRA
jgi:hypothetical protein